MGDRDDQRLQQTPKPHYRCQHVQAGYLTAVRVDVGKAVLDLCASCHEKGYHSLKLTDNGGVVEC